MSEEILNDEVVDETVDTEEVEQEAVVDEKVFTQEEVDKMIADRLSRAEKAKAKAVAEAEKLAKMNEAEKIKYEHEQLQARLADYEKKEARDGLVKEAKNMLKEKSVVAPDSIVEYFVQADAETTKTAVNALTEWVEDLQKEWEIKRNTGVTPKKLENTPSDPFAEAIKKFK